MNEEHTAPEQITTDEILMQVLKESHDLESSNEQGFVFFQEERNADLIQMLYKQRKQVPIFDMALRSIAEHMFILTRIKDHVVEMEETLRSHGIKVESMIREEEA